MRDGERAQDVAAPSWAGRRAGDTKPGLVWLALLVLAILAGSSPFELGVAGKSAPLYWVELWALVAYPLYVVAVARGRVPRLGTFFLLAGVGLLWEILAVPRSPDPLRGLRVLPMHVAGLAVYCFAVSVRLSRRDVAAAFRLLALSALILLVFSL